MPSFLTYLLLFCISSTSSRSLNSKNVSLTTELIPYTSDKRSLNLYKSKATNYKTEQNFYDEYPEDTHSASDNETTKYLEPSNDKSSNPDESSGKSLIKSSPRTTSMVFPFKPKFTLKKFAKNSCKALRIVLLPSMFSGENISVLYTTSAVGTLLSSLLLYAGLSEGAFKFLRDNWAFQGEMDKGSVESYTRMGLVLFGFDLLFRTVFLRANLIRNLSNANFFETVNWLGKNLGKFEKGLGNKVLVGFAKTLVLTRMTLLTYLHYLLMKTNWCTASFVVKQENCSSAMRMVLSFFFVSFFGHVVDTVLFGSLSSFLDMDHLLEPMEFRARELKKQVFESLTSIYRTLPNSLQKLLSPKYRYSMDLYEVAKACDCFNPTELEWSVLFVNLAMALQSHSGAGMYLALIQTLGVLLKSLMDTFEKGVINENL